MDVNATLPEQLTETLQRFEAFNFDISVFSSLACLKHENGFRRFLLAFTILPFIAILVMALPTLWAQYKQAAEIARARRARFAGAACFLVVLAYMPVSDVAVSSLHCLDFGKMGSYLSADFRVDCASDEYQNIRMIGILAVVLWPLGAILVIALLMVYYKIPQLAKRKIQKAEWQALLLYAIANARKLGIDVPDMASLKVSSSAHDLSSNTLRTLIRGVNSDPGNMQQVPSASDT